MTVSVDRSRPDPAPSVSTASRSLLQRPLWILSGQLGIVLSVFIGFGARAGFKPKLTLAMLSCCVVGMVGLGPPRGVNRIVVTLPVVAASGWWMASYLWTFNVFGWWTDTQLFMPFVVVAVVFVGMLPADDFRAALVAGCYIAIAYTLVEIAVHPGAATVNPDGVVGWRGGFIHKNSMGPFMVFAVLVLMTFDRPSLRRRAAVAVAVALIIVSQSTTALAAGVVTLFVAVLLHRLARGTRPARASLVAGALCTAVLGGVLASNVFPAVLGISGKDPTLTGRTDIWRGVWSAIERRPWQGYGVGGVWRDPSVDPARSILRGLGFTVFHSHNGFLEVMLVLGAIGLGLFVWLLVSTVRLGLTNLRTDTPGAVCAVGLVVVIVMVSISEVAVFGIWLGLISAFQCALTRTDAHRRGLPSITG